MKIHEAFNIEQAGFQLTILSDWVVATKIEKKYIYKKQAQITPNPNLKEREKMIGHNLIVIIFGISNTTIVLTEDLKFILFYQFIPKDDLVFDTASLLNSYFLKLIAIYDTGAKN